MMRRGVWGPMMYFVLAVLVLIAVLLLVVMWTKGSLSAVDRVGGIW